MTPSWQARLYKKMLRATIKRLFASIETEEDITRARSILSRRSMLSSLLRLTSAPQRTTEVGGVPAEWAGRNTAQTVILYLHGGAYFFGSPASHRVMVEAICRQADAKALLLDYRLAPENPFPAALDDALSAYEGLLAQGADPKDIVIAGDSAGGGLSLALLLRLRDEKKPLPTAGVLLSPWTDLTGSGESVRTLAEIDDMLYAPSITKAAAYYHAEESVEHPYISPLFADLKGLPPLLIQVGTHEILLSDATRLVKKAHQANLNITFTAFEAMPHVHQLAYHFVPEAKVAVQEIARYIRSHALISQENTI